MGLETKITAEHLKAEIINLGFASGGQHFEQQFRYFEDHWETNITIEITAEINRNWNKSDDIETGDDKKWWENGHKHSSIAIKCQ